MSIVGISGSLSSPSRTTALVELIVGRSGVAGAFAKREIINVGDIAPSLGLALNPKQLPVEVKSAYEQLVAADLVVVATPVYKGSYTGLLKHFFDLLDPKVLSGKVAILAATGGSDHHSLVLEHQLRPLLSFFGAYTVPTSVYVKDTDFVKDGSGASNRLDNDDVSGRIDTIVEQALWLTGRNALQAIAA
jgi:FMN reductase